ncbi:hypothetical protein FMN50_16415 [Rhodobacterales bacterium]|nr:hypothetical protein FMN50_16415 [Rhodobacterales bacterium]
MAAIREAEAKEEDKQTEPVPFTVSFNSTQSKGIVFGSLAIGIMFAAIGLIADIPLLILAAAAPLASAYWYYPMIETGRPQLGANEDGLYVERIGFIDWGAIRMTDVKRKKVRNVVEQIHLDVLLTRSMEAAVNKGQTTPLWKKYMMRNWKRTKREHGRELIAIDLRTLDADPDEILTRIRAFKAV